MRPLPVVAVTALVAFLAFALWYSREHPRVIVGSGSVTVTSERPPFKSLTLNTRDVEINRVRFREVELPGGTWIDCAGDCPAATRRAREEFWETQERGRK